MPASIISPPSPVVVGLIVNDASAAVRNTAILQAALAAKGLVIVNAKGVVNITSAGLGTEILKIYDDTELNINAGTIIRGPSSATPAVSLIANSNWRSNHVAISSISSTITGVAPYLVTSTITFSAATTLTVGGRLLIKGDTTGVYNGVFPIVSVSTVSNPNDTVTVNLYGFSTSPANGAGTMIGYPANANIHVTGDGQIDANLNNNTSGSLGSFSTMACLMQKVGDWSWDVPVINGVKYGVYYGNSWRAKLRIGTAYAPSNPVQGIGPLFNTKIIDGGFGFAGDDFTAFTVNNTGYTAYDVLDADGTRSSNGDVIGFRVEADFIERSTSRIATFGSGAGGIVKDVSIIGTVKGSSRAGLYIQLSVSTGETGTFENIEIDGFSGSQQLGQAIVLFGGDGTSTIVAKDVRVKNVRSHGGDGTSTGLTAPIILGASPAITITGLSLDSVDVDVDLANATGSVYLVSFGIAAAAHTVNGLQLSNIRARGTGAAFGMSGVLMSNNAQFDEIQINNVSIKGNNSSIASITSAQADPSAGRSKLLVSNCLTAGDGTHNGQSVVTLSGAKNLEVEIANCAGRNALNGAISISGSSSKTFDIKVSGLKTSNKFIVNGGTSHTFTVQETGIVCDNNTKASGNMVAVGTTSTWNFDGANLDVGIDVSTIARRDGAVIYNTNAALGTLGVAGLVCGQGTAAGSWHLMSDPTKSY